MDLSSPIPKGKISIEQFRVALIEASKAIHDLALGPTEGLISTAISVCKISLSYFRHSFNSHQGEVRPGSPERH
jgi:hypothetical protein